MLLRVFAVVAMVALSQSVNGRMPDVAGRWICDTPPGSAGPAPPVCEYQCTITVDAKVLSVSYPTATPLTYNLDGSPTTKTGKLSGTSSVKSVSVLAVDRGTVLLTSTTTVGSATLVSKSKLSLRAAKLVIETTQSGAGRGATSRTFEYSKVK